MSTGFRLLEHTADLGLEARGADLCAALDRAVAALGCILAGQEQADLSPGPALELTEDDPDALVVALLSECLFQLEVEGWLARGARLEPLPHGGVHGRLLGEPWDPERHDGVAIKAITWHQLSVERGPQGLTITAYVDC
jgi:SHS2 domain-containing protein